MFCTGRDFRNSVIKVKEAFSLGKEWPNDHVEWANVLEGIFHRFK